MKRIPLRIVSTALILTFFHSTLAAITDNSAPSPEMKSEFTKMKQLFEYNSDQLTKQYMKDSINLGSNLLGKMKPSDAHILENFQTSGSNSGIPLSVYLKSLHKYQVLEKKEEKSKLKQTTSKKRLKTKRSLKSKRSRHAAKISALSKRDRNRELKLNFKIMHGNRGRNKEKQAKRNASLFALQRKGSRAPKQQKKSPQHSHLRHSPKHKKKTHKTNDFSKAEKDVLGKMYHIKFRVLQESTKRRHIPRKTSKHEPDNISIGNIFPKVINAPDCRDRKLKSKPLVPKLNSQKQDAKGERKLAGGKDTEKSNRFWGGATYVKLGQEHAPVYINQSPSYLYSAPKFLKNQNGVPMPLPDSMAFSPPNIPVSASFSLRDDGSQPEYGEAGLSKNSGYTPKSVDIRRAWQGQMAPGTVPMYSSLPLQRMLKQVPAGPGVTLATDARPPLG